jgi:hypothetical protein
MGHPRSVVRTVLRRWGTLLLSPTLPLLAILVLQRTLLHRNKDSSPAIVYTARPGNIDVPAPRSRRRWPRKVVGRLRRHRS